MMKITLLVLLCIACVFGQTCTSVCEKVNNATDCVWYNSQNEATQIMQAFSGLRLEQTTVGGPYSACVKILFTKVCVNVEFEDYGDFFTNITLSITVDGIKVFSIEATLPQLLQSNGGLCLDDNTVLEILALIPEFENSIETIMKILELTGCEPRGLFSMCFYFENCTTTASTAVAADLCGCFQFDFQLLYWRDYCLYKDVANLGCIGTPPPAAIALPHPEPLSQDSVAKKDVARPGIHLPNNRV